MPISQDSVLVTTCRGFTCPCRHIDRHALSTLGEAAFPQALQVQFERLVLAEPFANL